MIPHDLSTTDTGKAFIHVPMITVGSTERISGSENTVTDGAVVSEGGLGPPRRLRSVVVV